MTQLAYTEMPREYSHLIILVTHIWKKFLARENFLFFPDSAKPYTGLKRSTQEAALK